MLLFTEILYSVSKVVTIFYLFKTNITISRLSINVNQQYAIPDLQHYIYEHMVETKANISKYMKKSNPKLIENNFYKLSDHSIQTYF